MLADKGTPGENSLYVCFVVVGFLEIKHFLMKKKISVPDDLDFSPRPLNLTIIFLSLGFLI